MRSDHHLIGIHVTLIDFPRGRVYWKFNPSLLEDNLVKNKTKSFITEFFQYNIGSANPLIVWGTFKMYLQVIQFNIDQ